MNRSHLNLKSFFYLEAVKQTESILSKLIGGVFILKKNTDSFKVFLNSKFLKLQKTFKYDFSFPPSGS